MERHREQEQGQGQKQEQEVKPVNYAFPASNIESLLIHLRHGIESTNHLPGAVAADMSLTTSSDIAMYGSFSLTQSIPYTSFKINVPTRL